MSKAVYSLGLLIMAIWIFATKDNPVVRVNGAIYLTGAIILVFMKDNR